MVSLALPDDLIRGLSSNRRAWCMAYVSQQIHVIFACEFFFLCFIVDPTFVAGYLGHEFALSAWGFPHRVFPSCVCCACVAVIDAPVRIIVVMGWVLLWYSWRPHNTLVLFVGEAALRLWGWLPWPSSLHLRSSSCERFGASQWWCWSSLSQSVTALIASIAIGHVFVDWCHLSQMRLAPTLMLRSQLRFLLVYWTK
jgi:hypothetical protein